MSELKDLDLGVLNKPQVPPANPEFSLSQTPPTPALPIRPAPAEQSPAPAASPPVVSTTPAVPSPPAAIPMPPVPAASPSSPARPVQVPVEKATATPQNFLPPDVQTFAVPPPKAVDFSLPKPAQTASFDPVRESPVSPGVSSLTSATPPAAAQPATVPNSADQPDAQPPVTVKADSQGTYPQYSNNTRAVWHVQKHQNIGFYILILIAVAMIGGGIYMIAQSGSVLEVLETPALKNILQSE